MAILITYPKSRVPVYWRIKLEQKDDVYYFPFRILKMTKLSAAEKQVIKGSSVLVITSVFGAQIFCDRLRKLNSRATIYVRNERVKKMLITVNNPVEIAPADQADAIAAMLAKKGVTDACWLIGDKHAADYQNYVGNKLVIYTDSWDQVHEGKALKLFMKQHITSALVTSPDKFDRMYEVLMRIDSNEYKRINYYVLDKKTGDYLQQKGLHVIFPDNMESADVYEDVLDALWKYERVH